MSDKINVAVLEENEKAAREAGFIAAANKLKETARRARSLSVAYEHYRYVTEEQVAAFNLKLKAKTERPATPHDQDKLSYPLVYYTATMVCDQLVMHALDCYEGLPPADVLAAAKIARDRGCFDGFEVAEVQPISTEIKLPDPIVFGRIDGCTDRFFICEWGTDVSIRDLIGEHDG